MSLLHYILVREIKVRCFTVSTCVCLQGRKSVRYGDFQFCEQAKSVIVVSISNELNQSFMFNANPEETSLWFCVCLLEEHQSSVQASPGGGDAFLCCCSSVLCSEEPQLAGTDHPLLWYIWTLLPSIPLSPLGLAQTTSRN